MSRAHAVRHRLEAAVKIDLIQLPLQSHDYVYSPENIPPAAGHLAACLEARKAPV